MRWRGICKGACLFCLLVALHTAPPVGRTAFPNQKLASQIAHGKWEKKLLFTPKQIEFLAYHLSGPHTFKSSEGRKRILERVREAAEEMCESSQIQLAGSHADGTAIPGISDLDIWIASEPLSLRQRKEIFHVILDSCPCSFGITGRETGIGRKAMKFQVQDLDLCLSQLDSFNLDVVCLNMIRDIGLDDNDLPSFTRCASRAEGRRKAKDHLQSCPGSVSAILLFKAFTCNGTKTTIPGYFLNHFARRLCEEHLQVGQPTRSSADQVFCAMVETFLAFCEYQDRYDWVANPASGSDSHVDSPTGLKMQDLPRRCEILWDLWKDCVAYDVAHPGATRANRLRGAFGLARHMLLEVLAARREDDLDFFRTHCALYRCPESFWSKN